MTTNDPQNKTIVSRPSGFFEDIVNRFRLVGRLMMDPRVNPLLKVLPVGTLVYLISPVDLMPVNPVDDAFIIWAGTTLFISLCPSAVIEEHMQALGRMIKGETNRPGAGGPEGDIIDGDYREVKPRD